MREKSLRSLIKGVSDMDDDSKVSQSIYVIEECSELIKELTKRQRGKSDESKIFDEACDVLTTVFVLLHRMGVSEDRVKDQIMYKCDRALSRYAQNGEI